eukprot:gene56571-75544_t
MAGILERIHRAKRPPFHAMGVVEARKAYTSASEVLELPRAPLARVENFTLPAADGTPLPARLYAASTGQLPLLLYLHGGGFVIGENEAQSASEDVDLPYPFRSGDDLMAIGARDNLSIAGIMLANEMARRPEPEIRARLARIRAVMDA